MSFAELLKLCLFHKLDFSPKGFLFYIGFSPVNEAKFSLNSFIYFWNDAVNGYTNGLLLRSEYTDSDPLLR